MKNALKSFFGITVLVLIGSCLTWFYLKGRALSQAIQPPPSHPFLTRQPTHLPFWIAYQGSSADLPPNTFAAFDAAAAIDPHLILWVDVRFTKDGTLVAFSEQDLASTTNGTGWVSYTGIGEVETLDAGAKFRSAAGDFPFRGKGLRIPKLKDVLERYPGRRLVLNFRDYRPGIDDRIITLIDEAKAGDRVLIQSEQDGILKDLREKRPLWLFGTSQARVTQLRMLTALGLEAMAPLKGDVYVSEVRRGGNELLDDSVITEIHRRRMKILVGPVDDRAEAEALLARGVDGIITRRPVELMRR